MSVNPGFGGQSFIENTYKKVSQLKHLIEFTESECLIEIDGGVTSYNANALIEAGANVLVAGSYVFGAENPTKTIADLNKHKFISFGKGTPSPVFNPDWALKVGIKDSKKRKSVMKVNSVMGLLLAVESGVGLAALPDYLSYQSKNIIKVLPKVEGPITEAHFVYPQSMKNVARVQVFRNFLYSKISEWEF